MEICDVFEVGVPSWPEVVWCGVYVPGCLFAGETIACGRGRVL
jgi:hypothetical protein